MRDRNYLFLEESLDDQLRHRHGGIRGAAINCSAI